MKKKLANKKLLRNLLILVISMSVVFGLSIYFKLFHNVEYREEKCLQEMIVRGKNYSDLNGSYPDEMVSRMYYESCMQKYGWIR